MGGLILRKRGRMGLNFASKFTPPLTLRQKCTFCVNPASKIARTACVCAIFFVTLQCFLRAHRKAIDQRN